MKTGRKDDSDKLRYDLIPPEPLGELVRVYTIGARKYEDRNWENGLKWGRVFAALMRHAWAWWRGELYDLEDGQHHLASVAWCAFALMEYETTCPDLDDRPEQAQLFLAAQRVEEENERNDVYMGTTNRAVEGERYTPEGHETHEEYVSN